jgi:Domain of unknown function (DUF4190)
MPKQGEPPRRSGEATASLVLGLFSFVPVVGLLAVIFGHMAKASIRRSGGRLLGEGMAGVGLVFGYLGLGGWIIYAVSTMIHPFLPSTRMESNEQLVISSLRTLNTSVITYSTMYDHGYPTSLAALGPPAVRPNASTDEIVHAESANAAGLIDEVLASGTEFGYRFTYTPGKKKTDRSIGDYIEEYTIHADPITPGETGRKYFFTDDTQVIRVEIGKQAGADSLPIGDSTP